MARVVSVNAKKQQLDLTLLPRQLHGNSHPLVPAAEVTAAAAAGGTAVPATLPDSCLVMGRLSRVQVGVLVLHSKERWLSNARMINDAICVFTQCMSMGFLQHTLSVSYFCRCATVQGGLRVHLGGRLHGTVALTDVHDTYVANALTGLKEGSFVRACVLACSSEAGSGSGSKPLPHVSLSLRPSDGGAVPDAATAAAAAQVCWVLLRVMCAVPF